MSDEEDYMSNAFLEDIREGSRGGLLPRSVKRKLDIEKKRIKSNKMFKTKSIKQLEEESRNAGLDTAISTNNKGFSLLQKMGYKPGMKLGKESSSSSESRGLTEPIKVQVKTGRGGLGRDEAVRHKIERLEERKRKMKVYKEQETKLLTEEFRDRMRNQRLTMRLMKDLHKCQKVCEQLDQQNQVEEPMRPWFWYTQELRNDEDEEELEEDEQQEEISPEEKLDFICEYIRPKYFYCFWCCIKYDNEDDLNLNCPGPDKNDHDDLSS